MLVPIGVLSPSLLTFATRKSAKMPLPPSSSRPRETTSLAILDVHACIQLVSISIDCAGNYLMMKTAQTTLGKLKGTTSAGYTTICQPCLNCYGLLSICLPRKACTVASQREAWPERCPAFGQAFLGWAEKLPAELQTASSLSNTYSVSATHTDSDLVEIYRIKRS